MSNPTFTIAAPQPSHHPNLPAPLVHLGEWSIALLVIAGMSWLVRRKRSLPINRAPSNQSFDWLGLESLNFSQPMQWVSYGKQIERSQQFLVAVAVYDRGLRDYPNDFHLWHERGLALAKLQQFEAALASYDRAYQIRPEHRDLGHERGDTLLQLGRYQEAVASFDIFLKYVPNKAHLSAAHVLADRGYALFQLGRYSEAVRSLKPVLKDKRGRDARAYARYYYTEALRQSGQLEAALQSAQAAMKQHPEERFRVQYESLRHQLS